LTETLNDACANFLKRLPESRGTAEELARAAGYFGLGAAQLDAAAARLETDFDCGLRGVRMLLGAFFDEFLRVFRPTLPAFEVTVPAPLGAIMALQEAARGKYALETGALAAQIGLRALLLDRRPLEFSSCGMRRCGLNRMRERLFRDPPAQEPAGLLQFGILCGECAKCGEGLTDRAVTAMLPKASASGGFAREHYFLASMERFMEEACRSMGLRPDAAGTARAQQRYGRLCRVERKIAALAASPDRLPPGGNTLALAQSAQLMVFDDWERVLGALETFAEELQNAPPSSGEPRIYAFFVPFLQPEIDARFRANGVRLLGNAAFLTETKRVGFSPAEMAAAWAQSLCAARDAEGECRAIAAAVRAASASRYLTGMFAFDRWMGAAAPLQRRILREKFGVESVVLDADFWCENAMFGGMDERVDAICAALN